jgi:transcriptional regulator NrdR family protein
MNLAVDIIKHNGKRPTEQFVRDKLYDSIIKTCLSVHTPEGQAENIADTVCDLVTVWLQKRPEVTSNDIRIVTARHLTSYHPEAAYLYEQHPITI